MTAAPVSLSKFRSFGEAVGAAFGRHLSTPPFGPKKMAFPSSRPDGFFCGWHRNSFPSARNELVKVPKIGASRSRCTARSVSSSLCSFRAFDFCRRQLYATSSIRSGRKTLDERTDRRGAKGTVLRSRDFEAISAGNVQQKGKPLKRSVSVRSSKVRAGSSSAQKRSLKPSLTTTKSTSARVDSKKSRDSKLSTRTTSFAPAVKKAEKKPIQTRKRSEEVVDSKDSIQATNADKPKKGKRIMRLDPKDKTSKRLSDGYPLPGEEGAVVEEETADDSGLSKSAQFRAIVPAPKLLLHIERHMLGRRRQNEWQKAGYDVKLTPAPLDNAPHGKKDERQPIQEEVFRHKLRFAAAAKISSSFPPVDVPEVAFAGRSNVGKSSLINALTRQWGVARTSDKPGLTQSINFFRLGGRICLVDLPGYGFAYAKEEKKDAWEELVKEFVTTRAGLKRVCILIDAKWGVKPRDKELIELMESAGTKYQIVLTKSDTIFPIDLARRVTQIQEVFKDHKSLVLPLMMVSSKTGEGLGLLRANLAKLAKASLI